MNIGGIEAGGTKFVCGIGDERGNIIKRVEFPTTSPEETLAKVITFFKDFDVQALGIGSFGPVDIRKDSSTYGHITTTPKHGWGNFPLVQTLEGEFHVPIGFNTDVNAAALAEATLGAAKGLDSCLYITIGTGIGAGAFVQGKLLQGLSHPEMGHILVKRHPKDSYAGTCPYHGDCLEGVAAGPAIEARWGQKGFDLQERPEVWELEGYYIAQALMQYILIISPKKIILGGGVMKQTQIFPAIYRHLQSFLNGYVAFPELLTDIDQYIVSPELGNDSGLIGSILLGKQAVDHERNV